MGGLNEKLVVHEWQTDAWGDFVPLMVPQAMFDDAKMSDQFKEDCAKGLIRPIPMLNTDG